MVRAYPSALQRPAPAVAVTMVIVVLASIVGARSPQPHDTSDASVSSDIADDSRHRPLSLLSTASYSLRGPADAGDGPGLRPGYSAAGSSRRVSTPVSDTHLELRTSKDAWCSDSNPVARGDTCDPSWSPDLINHNKCRPQLQCVNGQCVEVLPGDPCEADSDCAVSDTGCWGNLCGYKRGYNAVWIGMSCLPTKRCGYYASEGDGCVVNGTCASGSCSVQGLCVGISAGSPCDPRTAGNPCKANAFCQYDPTRSTANGLTGTCTESSSFGESCVGQSLVNTSLVNVADECPPGSSCNTVPGVCAQEFSRGPGEDCSGSFGARLCQEGLACIEATDGKFRCHNTGPTCNATSPCPLGGVCMCDTGTCLAVSLPTCNLAFEEYVTCINRFRCHNHNMFGFHPLQPSLCARNCADKYTEYQCCLAGELEYTETIVQCPGQTIEVGVSIAIMVAGGVFGLMLGIFVGVLCARRRAAINSRYLALLTTLQQQGGGAGGAGARAGGKQQSYGAAGAGSAA